MKLIAESNIQPTPLNMVGHTSKVTLDVIAAAGKYHYIIIELVNSA